MEGANVPVDEAAEERKGGANDLGKVRTVGEVMDPAALSGCCAS